MLVLTVVGLERVLVVSDDLLGHFGGGFTGVLAKL